MESTSNANGTLAVAISNSDSWASLNRITDIVSDKDPMSTVKTFRCCYSGCGVRLGSVGWICLCQHTFCDMHAPAIVRDNSGPNHRRRCHRCQTDLLPKQVNRFSVEDNRAVGLFSQVGRTPNEVFDMLEFTLKNSVKHDLNCEAIVAKLRELEKLDDRDLAEAEAELAALAAEKSDLQLQCGKKRHACQKHGKSLTAAEEHLAKMAAKSDQYGEACKLLERNIAELSNKRDGLKRQLTDREEALKRLKDQLTAARARLRGYKRGNVSVEPSVFEHRVPNAAANTGAAAAATRYSSGVGTSRYGDIASSIGPSASAVGMLANESAESDSGSPASRSSFV